MPDSAFEGLKTIPESLLFFPIQTPPEGVVATFEPDHRVTLMVKTIAIIAFAIVGICAMLRLYTKLKIMKSWGWIDYGFVITWILYISFWATGWQALHVGIFHQYNVYLKDAHFFLYWYPLVAIQYEFCIAAIKVVICCELIRIFVPRRRGWLYWSYIVVIVVSCLSGFICGFLEAFHCTPYDKQFYPLLLINPNYGKCFDLDTARVAFSACLVLQDLALFVLPQYSIWTLKMSIRKKIGVSVLFGIGLAACLFSTVRLFYTIRVKTRIDDLWWLAFLGFFLTLELSCGIVIAAAPVLPRFFKTARDTKVGQKFKMVFGSARSFVSSRSRKKQREFSPDVTPLQNLASTQVSANTQTTAVSDTDQRKNSHYIAKTVEWNVEAQQNTDSIGVVPEVVGEPDISTPPKAMRIHGHQPSRSRDSNDAETDREIQSLLQEDDALRPAWSALPRRSDHSVPRTSTGWNFDLESAHHAQGYGKVQQRDDSQHSQTRKPAWPSPPGWI